MTAEPLTDGELDMIAERSHLAPLLIRQDIARLLAEVERQRRRGDQAATNGGH